MFWGYCPNPKCGQTDGERFLTVLRPILDEQGRHTGECLLGYRCIDCQTLIGFDGGAAEMLTSEAS